MRMWCNGIVVVTALSAVLGRPVAGVATESGPRLTDATENTGDNFTPASRRRAIILGDRLEGGGVPPVCGPLALTQNTDPDTLTAPSTAECAGDNAAFTTANGLARSFSIAPGEGLVVECVEFGIQFNVGGPWQVIANIYSGEIAGPLGGLTLLGESTPVTIPDGAMLEFFTATFPAGVVVPGESQMVVELFIDTRDPAEGGPGGATFLGSNNLGESAPSYLRAPACGVDNFTPLTALGYPDAHLVMTVFGSGGALPCGPSFCPIGSFDEGEPCGQDTNGGCNSAVPNAFQPIACGNTVCGSFWADNGIRDTDWYELTTTTSCDITWAVTSNAPVTVLILDNNCSPATVLASGTGQCPTAATACLGPGTYRLFVAPQAFSGLPCGFGDQNFYLGEVFCACPCGNDACDGRDDIFNGNTSFSTVGASTNGPALPASCDEGFGLSFVNDIWYNYHATCTGPVTISTCNQVNYDSRLAVYQGCACPPDNLNLVACNDDFPGCGLSSQVTFNAVCGLCYKVRVGGYSGSGSGTLSVSCQGGCACTPPPPNMVGWWPLDEVSGSLAGERLYSNDGFFKPDVFTGPASVSGLVANSRDFDGTDDYVDVPANSDLALGFSDFTVDAWIYWDPPDPNVNGEIVTQTGYRFRIIANPNGNAGLLLWLIGGGDHKCLKFDVIPPHQWTHVAATFKQQGISPPVCKLYVNSALVHTSNPSPNNMSTNGVVQIGTAFGPVNYFKGKIDEVEIFNRELSQNEIAAIYSAGSAGKCKPPCLPPSVSCMPALLCPNGLPYGFLRGENDDFCLPPEPTTPSPALSAAVPSCANGKNFDDMTIDTPLCHSFVGLPNNIASATLEIRMKAGQSGLACNDGIALQVTGGSPVFAWSSNIGSATSGYTCGGSPGLLGAPWLPGTTKTFCLDLSNLPTSGGPFLNLLPFMNSSGRLDIYVQDDTGVDYAFLRYTTCPTCVTPPPNMISWWPLDENVGPVAGELITQNHGLHVNSPTPVAGKVAGALQFNGTNQYVVAPNTGGMYDFGGGPFSIDAWVKWDGTHDGTIVANQGTTFYFPTFNFFVEGTGALAVGLRDNCVRVCTLSGAGVVPPNVWTHVALTASSCGCLPPLSGQFACCDSNPGRVYKLYVGGALVHTYSSGFGNNFSFCKITNPGPLYIGWGTSECGDYFPGAIDEVEVFNRVLSQPEIASIANAGSLGKCKQKCHVPWDAPFCANDLDITVTIDVCNCSSMPQTYSLAFSGLPTGPNCNIVGPTVFTVLGPNPVTVPPNTCTPVQVKIGRPAGMNTLLDVGCYDFTMTNVATGQANTCHGSVQDRRDLCAVIAADLCCIAAQPVGVGSVGTPISWEVTNTDIPAGIAVPYMILAYGPDMLPSQAIRLNGLPPGTPVEGTLLAPPGGTTDLSLSVSYDAFEPLAFSDVVAFTDVDADGNFEPLVSAGVFSALPAPPLPDIVMADPPQDNPYVAGTQPFRDVLSTGTTAALTQGIGGPTTPPEDTIHYNALSVWFSWPPAVAPTPANIALNCTNGIGFPWPALTGVIPPPPGEAGPYQITLSGPIAPAGCLTMTFAGTSAGQKLQYQSLPGDVNLSGTSGTSDLLVLLNAINNGQAAVPENLARYDINRTGSVSATDLIRELQLLNGVNTVTSWSGKAVDPCP